MKRVSFVCLFCHRELRLDSEAYSCPKCKASYKVIQGVTVFLKNVSANEIKQKAIYEKKALDEGDFDFECLRDSFGFRFCRTLKDLKFVKLLRGLGIKEGDMVLDIGCFTGHILNRLTADFKIKGYGIDLSLPAIKQAKKYKDFQNQYCVASAYNLPFKENYFDGIISLDVLEHIDNKERFFEEILRTLKPGGWFLLYAVSNKYKYTLNWIRWLIKGKKGEYGYWGEAGHTTELLVSPKKLKEIIPFNKAKYKLVYFHAFFTLFFDLYVAKLFNKPFHLYLKHKRDQYKFIPFRPNILPFTVEMKGEVNAAKLEERSGKGFGGMKPLEKIPYIKRSREWEGFIFEKLYLGWYLLFFKISLFLCTVLDLAWSVKGLGNGFFLTGRKHYF